MILAIRFIYFWIILLFIPVISYPQKKNVTIRIAQNESVLLSSYDTILVLKKKSFRILVMLENTAGVYCFASFGDSIYRLTESDKIPGFADLLDLAMSEEEFNKEKQLMVSNDGWSYWVYDTAINWHRFDKKIVLLDSGRLVAEKRISQIYLVPVKKEIKLKEVNTPLYLFFVAISEFDSNNKPLKELMRRKVKIEWLDDD